METPVIRDIADQRDAAATDRPELTGTADPAVVATVPHAWPARRYSVDPSSSPQLMAAFAWDTRG